VIFAATVTLATGIAAPASAGSGSLSSNGCVASFSNWNSGSNGASRTVSNGSCGLIGLRGREYVGGGSYSYRYATEYYATIAATYTRFFSATINQSRHHFTIPGDSATYHSLNI